MKSLLNAEDGDSLFGDWEIPGTNVVLRIAPGMAIGRFELHRLIKVPDEHLTECLLVEFANRPRDSATAHAIARRIQELEATK